jgi:hypothetical protein
LRYLWFFAPESQNSRRSTFSYAQKVGKNRGANSILNGIISRIRSVINPKLNRTFQGPLRPEIRRNTELFK